MFVKKILNLRIEPLRTKISEEERIKVKLEAQRQARKAEEERIRKEKKAEEEKIRKQKEETRQKKLEEFSKSYPNVSIDIFIKIEAIIVEQLLVDEERVTMDADLTSDLSADSLDFVELMKTLEEEFDIEIPDNFTRVYLSVAGFCAPPELKPISVKQIVDLVCEKIH